MPNNKKEDNVLLEAYVQAMVDESLRHYKYKQGKIAKKLQQHDLMPTSKHYAQTAQQPAQQQQQTTVLTDEQRDYLTVLLRRMPDNITATKILRGLPLSKREVYVLAKDLVQTGKIPAKSFIGVARMLVVLDFDISKE